MTTRRIWVALLLGIVLWPGPAPGAGATPFGFPAVDG